MDIKEIVEKINMFERRLYIEGNKNIAKNLKRYLKFKEEYSKKIENKDR